jgi:hypothetical protein
MQAIADLCCCATLRPQLGSQGGCVLAGNAGGSLGGVGICTAGGKLLRCF